MKRFRSAVLLLSALIPASFAVAAAPPAPVADPRALYEAATVAANAGDYPRAVALCRQALKVSPEAAPVWATLGRFLSKQLRHNDAIAAAQKAVALSPKFAPFRADLGNFYLQAERRVEAAVSAQKALSLDPRNDIALTTLATCRLAERRDKEAIPLLTRLQSVRGGKNRAVSQTLIATYRRVGDMAGALRSAKGFAEKTPGDARSVLSVVQIALENRDVVSTQKYAAKLRTLASRSPLPDYYLGLLALSDPTKSSKERFQNGERLFQKAVDRSPNETLLRAQLGYAQLGQVSDDGLGKAKIEAARTNLTAAVLYENHDPVSRRGLAMVAEKELFWEDAATQYEAILKITPDDNDSRRRYAGVLLFMSRKDEAYRQFYILADRLPKDTTHLKELASFFVADKQYVKARGAYEQALERDPDDAEAHLGIAQCFVNEKRKPEARDAFERAIKANTKQETPYLLLAQLYTDDDADAESTKVLERMLVAIPGSNAGRWQLIERYIKAKRDEDARREIAKLTLKQNDPNRTRYRLAAGNLHLIRERWTDAVTEFERLVVEEPDNPDVLVTLADAYGKAGRKSEADAHYVKAVRLAEEVLKRSPDDRDAKAVLIHARKAQNNPGATK